MYEQIIDPQIQILERCSVAWEAQMPSLPEDLTPYGAAFVTKSWIRKSFISIIAKLNAIKIQSEEDVNPLLIQTISQNFPSWTTPIESWIVSGPSTIPNIMSHLNTIFSQFKAYENEQSVPNIETVQKLVTDIKVLQLEANGLVKAMADKTPEFEEKRDGVLNQCNQILIKATESLAASARAGLATSFEFQASEYNQPRKGWLYVFMASLFMVFIIAAYFVFHQLDGVKGIDRLYYFLTEIPLTLPFIWLAWFSALRFSQLGRLKEDYKFKVATALALDGYRKQAEDLSPALQEKLLDLAVTNFGENPLRLLTKDSAKDAHPLAGSLDTKTLNEIVKSAFQALSDKVSK